MAISRLLQLCLLLSLAGAAHQGPPPAPGASRVPDGHLKMLSGGLANLLREAEDNVRLLGRQGERAAGEARQASRGLEGLRQQSFLVGRTHRQARKHLQVMSARGDQMEGVVRELQTVLGLAAEDRGVLEHRMAQVVQKLRAASGRLPRPDAAQMKVTVANQTRRLAGLASEVIARDKMINRHLRSIEDLEKQLYDMREGRPLPPQRSSGAALGDGGGGGGSCINSPGDG